MSTAVTLEQVKRHLRVTHAEDDLLLQDLLDQAEDEARQYLGRAELPMADDGSSSSSEPGLAPSVRGAVYLLVQGMYEGVDAAQMQLVRAAAETKLHPYRIGLGV